MFDFLINFKLIWTSKSKKWIARGWAAIGDVVRVLMHMMIHSFPFHFVNENQLLVASSTSTFSIKNFLKKEIDTHYAIGI